MPLAALFIGRVLPVKQQKLRLRRVIRRDRRTGYMKYNLWLIQPVVEGPNFNKLQAPSIKLDNGVG